MSLVTVGPQARGELTGGWAGDSGARRAAEGRADIRIWVGTGCRPWVTGSVLSSEPGSGFTGLTGACSRLCGPGTRSPGGAPGDATQPPGVPRA